jgi:hypothetical protein
VLQDNRHEDGMMITWMQKEGEDKKRAAIMAEQLKKQGKSESEIKKIMKDYGMAYYDGVEYVDLIVKRMKKAGMSDEQIGEKLAHLQEHAEAENKERGLGYALYEEFDKTFRAINDFSGYQKLESLKGSEAMLKQLKETGKFEKIDDKTLRFHVKDETGKETGEFYDVTNFKTLQDAIGNTKSKYGNVYDHRRQADLGYELAGARKNMDAQKRKERGSSERWASNIEPAADKVQFANGKFRSFTSYGRTSVSKRPSAVITSLQQTRVIQARALKRVGLYKNEEGQYDLDPNTGSVDYQEMANLFYLNPLEASATISRAGLNTDQVEKIKNIILDKYTDYLVNIPKDENGKLEFNVAPGGERTGATIIFEQPRSKQK